jgi:hypothetical protein
MFGQEKLASHTPIKKPFQKMEGLVSDVEVSSGFPACVPLRQAGNRCRIRQLAEELSLATYQLDKIY